MYGENFERENDHIITDIVLTKRFIFVVAFFQAFQGF
jgi:hypothetical protein